MMDKQVLNLQLDLLQDIVRFQPVAVILTKQKKEISQMPVPAIIASKQDCTIPRLHCVPSRFNCPESKMLVYGVRHLDM